MCVIYGSKVIVIERLVEDVYVRTLTCMHLHTYAIHMRMHTSKQDTCINPFVLTNVPLCCFCMCLEVI